MKFYQRRKRAFTLIELLVVISIIALLIALLLPVLSKARQSGTTIQCLSNVRGMYLACAYFASDHKSWYPPNGSGVIIGSPGNTKQVWFTDYLDSNARFTTGSGGEYLRADPAVGGVYGKISPVVRCPELSALVASTGRTIQTTQSNTDYAISLLTGQPVDVTVAPPNGNLSYTNPWQYDVSNTSYWKFARNCVSSPALSQAGLGNYGPYRSEEVPSRVVFLADTSVEYTTASSSVFINNTFQWYTQSGGYAPLGPTLAGSLSNSTQTSYYAVDPGTGPMGSANPGVEFSIHFRGFNASYWDGSGRTNSHSAVGTLPFGTYNGSPSLYYVGAGRYQNVTAWCPIGTAGDASRGNFRYGNGTGL